MYNDCNYSHSRGTPPPPPPPPPKKKKKKKPQTLEIKYFINKPDYVRHITKPWANKNRIINIHRPTSGPGRADIQGVIMHP